MTFCHLLKVKLLLCFPVVGNGSAASHPAYAGALPEERPGDVQGMVADTM